MKTFIGLAFLASAVLVSAQPADPQATTVPLVTPTHPGGQTHAPELTTPHPDVTTPHPNGTHPADVTTQAPPTTTHVETVTSHYHSKYVNNVCNFTACVEPHCQCLNDKPPRGLLPEQIPQFVTITFDGAITVTNFPFFKQLFSHKNPTGCPIQATYFVSHVDTNYKLVHDLHRHGNEIGVHSISKSKNNYQDYWKNLQYDEWRAEMGGQRRIISKLADIPIEQIKGARAPNLQTAGNITIAALVTEKFEYDCSFPSRKGIQTPFFPYTLDYGGQHDQDCPVGPCIENDQLFPGFWDVPMNDLVNQYIIKKGNETETGQRECATASGCILYNADGTVNYTPNQDQIYELFKKNFDRFYNGNKAPFPLFLSEDWMAVEGKRNGLLKFIEDVSKEHKDVFFVSIDEVINWMKNSVPVSEYSAATKCKEIPQTKCAMDDSEPNLAIQFPKFCDFEQIGALDGQTKHLVICDNAECPTHYPWTHQES